MIMPSIKLWPLILDKSLRLDLLSARALNISDEFFNLNNLLVVDALPLEIPITELFYAFDVEVKLVN
jgi:hypothetical protein